MLQPTADSVEAQSAEKAKSFDADSFSGENLVCSAATNVLAGGRGRLGESDLAGQQESHSRVGRRRFIH